MFEHLFEIRKQSALEVAEEDHELKDEPEYKHEPEDVFEHESGLQPEPLERTKTVSRLT
jgi:hypothetical protein